ncbi:hypothetical protein [Fimbriiglobus ruber]|uniref:Uncharacterized protein n=1 Tax=Fimbriiglobus ruber TaxID=1908690 RepID=A0A225CY92_9BACT|nr:hypothetical protein [Fimbriiglobus ruber]OWK34311.1 hypothetical protein FRUB_10282 [Fimbriiglobus ruber]
MPALLRSAAWTVAYLLLTCAFGAIVAGTVGAVLMPVVIVILAFCNNR